MAPLDLWRVVENAARYATCLKALRESISFFVPPLHQTAGADTLRAAGVEDKGAPG